MDTVDGYSGVSLFVRQNKDADRQELARGALEHLDALNYSDFKPSYEVL